MSQISMMMNMIGSVMPKAQPPANPVAEFLSGSVDKLYPNNEIAGMIKTVLVDAANQDPDGVMRALILVHNDIAEFAQSLQE